MILSLMLILSLEAYTFGEERQIFADETEGTPPVLSEGDRPVRVKHLRTDSRHRTHLRMRHLRWSRKRLTNQHECEGLNGAADR